MKAEQQKLTAAEFLRRLFFFEKCISFAPFAAVS